MEFKQGQKLNVKIEKLSLGGDGIARVGEISGHPSRNYVVFVPYSSPGDELEVSLTEKKRSYGRGRIREILKKSPQHTIPLCPYYFSLSQEKWCGGCNFQHLKYAAQVREKEKILKEALVRIAGMDQPVVLPAIAMDPETEWRYRNKIQIPFTMSDGQGVTAGFYAPGTHSLVPIEDCLIHSEETMAFVNFVRRKMSEWNLAPYSESRHEGWLRHLVVRQESRKQEIIAVFVTADRTFPRQAEWLSEIREKFPNVVGICQNVNSRKTNVIMGREWKTLFGRDFFCEEFEGIGAGRSALKLKISADSFFQVNTAMAKRLYETVSAFASNGGRKKREILLDLFCGVGGLGLVCAEGYNKVIGVDETSSSIRDANENARLNRISNCEFHCADVSGFLKKFPLTTYHLSLTTVILDPPRSGCSREILDRLFDLRPGVIIYVSCDPSTLARDLKILCQKMYKTEKIQPVDLFPQTSHVESVTLMRLAR